MTNPHDAWIGRHLSNGRYEITQKLGEGGMGSVYRATDKSLDTDVVIKIPRRAMLEDPEFAHRFSHEVRSLVKLSHPCIVKTTDVGEHDGVPFAVMQYLAGGSLEERRPLGPSGEPRPMPLESLRVWLPSIAKALDFVHSEGYVHRDVKPGNLLFDAHNNAYLSDFGIVKAVMTTAEEKTQKLAMTGTGIVLGTPYYMAPELVMGEPYDGRADQYALAVTIYELLCGRPPFDGATPTAILVLQSTKTPPALTEFLPECPATVSDALVRSLAKDPAARFPNCVALAREVLLAGKTTAPVRAVPVASAPPPEASGASAAGPATVRESVDPAAAKASGARPATVREKVGSGAHLRLSCPECKGPVSLSETMLAKLRAEEGRAFPCPSCQASLQVSAEGAPALSARRTPAVGQQPSTKQTSPKTTSPKSAKRKSRASKSDQDAEPNSNALFLALAGLGALALVASLVTVYAFRSSLFGPSVPTGRVRFQLASSTQGAKAELDERPFVLPPSETVLDLPLGAHTLKMTKPGWTPYAFTFEVTPNRAYLLRVNLFPETQKPALALGTPVPITPARPPAARLAVSPPAASVPAPVSRTIRPSASPAPPATPGGPPFGSSDASPTTAGPAMSTPPAEPPASEGGIPDEGTADRNKPKDDGGQKPADEADASPPAPADLPEVVASPQSFEGKVLVFNGLYRFGRVATFHPDGRATINVMQSLLFFERDRSLGLTSGQTSRLEVEPELCRRMVLHGVAGRFTPRFVPEAESWGQNVAIVTARVVRRGPPSEPKFVPVIQKAVFLVDLDFVRVGKGLYARAFKTLSLSAGKDAVEVGDGEDWAKRLGLRFTNTIKGMYKTAKYQQSMAKWVQFNNAINRVVAGARR